MIRPLPWAIGFALWGACVGPKGEQAPTVVHARASEGRSAGAPQAVEGEQTSNAVQGPEPQTSEQAEVSPEAVSAANGPEPVRHVDTNLTASAAEPEPADPDGAAEQTDAPAPDGADEEPQPRVNPALVRRGRQVFSNVCMLCHDMGPRIAGLGWTSQRMERKIRRGGTRMSAISTDKLPNPKLHALMAYLRTIGAVRGDEPRTGAASSDG